MKMNLSQAFLFVFPEKDNLLLISLLTEDCGGKQYYFPIFTPGLESQFQSL